MKTNNTVTRFVHGVDSLSDYNLPHSGFTICYTRNHENIVYFTYSLCLKEDQYNKKIGRETTQRTWKDNHPTQLVDNENYNSVICQKTRCGVLNINLFVEEISSLNMFSDSIGQKLTMFDFKHSFISRILSKKLTNFYLLTNSKNS